MSTDVSTGQLVAGIIGFILMAILTLAIIYDIIIKCISFNKGFKDKTTTDMKVLIYINVIITLLHIPSIIIRIMFARTDGACDITAKVGTVIYHCSRCTLYWIFVRRLDIISSYNQTDNTMSLNKCTTYTLYGIILLYFIPYVFYFDWTVPNGIYSGSDGCFIEYSIEIIVLIVFAIDIILAIICLYLFIKPLIKISKTTSQSGNKRVAEKLYHTMTKSAVLGIIAIVSSLILTLLFLGVGTYWYYFSIVDDFINGIVILLIHPIHSNKYMQICGIFHKCCLKCRRVSDMERERQLAKQISLGNLDVDSSTNNDKSQETGV